ncbi:hypothetical protein tb265_47290 [Gemmatimonadetes bacterium T265]|nr:hypothetical protein tb265_47290 [Gemmatimonadetes bacterium T265]
MSDSMPATLHTLLRRTLIGGAAALTAAAAAPAAMPAAAAAGAQSNVIDVNQPSWLTGLHFLRWYAQEFSPGTSNLSGVGFLLTTNGLPSAMTMAVFTDRPDLPDAVQIAAATDTLTVVNEGWVDFFFPPIAVTPGATYYLAARSTGVYPTIIGAALNVNVPGAGSLWFGPATAEPTGGAYGFNPLTMAFRTYTRAPTQTLAPEPATVALLLVGMGGVGLAARRRSPAARVTRV